MVFLCLECKTEFHVSVEVSEAWLEGPRDSVGCPDCGCHDVSLEADPDQEEEETEEEFEALPGVCRHRQLMCGDCKLDEKDCPFRDML